MEIENQKPAAKAPANSFEFAQAVRIERKTYPLGVHEVPPLMQKHPYFQKLMKAGLVAPVQVDSEGNRKKLSDLKKLPLAVSAAAKQSAAAAKAAHAEVKPEAVVGGDSKPAAAAPAQGKPTKGK